MARNRTRGFTLLEVMIVVVIVGVLAAIALPAYQSQVRRGNRSAAQQYLQDLANRQEQYRLDARAYATSASALGYAATPPTVSPNYTVSVATSGNDCGGTTAVVAPGYVITATPSTAFQSVDGPLCVDNLGHKTGNW
jgi:type IV pilus assembly protein PilE